MKKSLSNSRGKKSLKLSLITAVGFVLLASIFILYSKSNLTGDISKNNFNNLQDESKNKIDCFVPDGSVYQVPQGSYSIEFNIPDDCASNGKIISSVSGVSLIYFRNGNYRLKATEDAQIVDGMILISGEKDMPRTFISFNVYSR